MTTLPTALQAHLDTGSTTTALALRITRADGGVYGLTSAVNAPPPIDGVAYDPAPGLEASQLTFSAGFAVDQLEMSVLDDGALFTRVQVENGVWRNAAFLFFRYNWASPSDGVEKLLAGTLGNVEIQRGRVVCELRDLKQYLQQPLGNVTSRTCRARFADFPTANGNNRCTLAAATYTRTGTVSAVASAQQFTSSGLWTAQPVDDWYGDGLLTWTSGDNLGAPPVKVKTYVASGVITLQLPMAAAVQVGDGFSILAGCRKRRTEDCGTKFSNVVNFAGEPDLPGTDALLAVPEVDV